jgi:hypothetical protein
MPSIDRLNSALNTDASKDAISELRQQLLDAQTEQYADIISRCVYADKDEIPRHDTMDAALFAVAQAIFERQIEIKRTRKLRARIYLDSENEIFVFLQQG